MARPLQLKGASRLSVGQLLAVEIPRSTVFLLAKIRWLSVSGDSLRVGMELLPAPVQAVIAESDESPPAPCPALLIPAAPGGASGATVITAPGWFRVGRMLRIMA